MRPTLSLCLIVKNEELLLPQALLGMRDFVDECVVIDTGSTDRTVAIAREAGARIFHHNWDGDFGRARNAYVERATGSWILVLDGDEKIAEVDWPKIRPLIEVSGACGYTFTVRNYSRGLDLLGNWHVNTGTYPDEERQSGCPGRSEFDALRLFRRASGVRYEEGHSSHTNPRRSLRALGGEICHGDVVVHHFQWLKGGDAFVEAKQRERLAQEIRHADAWPADCLANLNVGRTLFVVGRDAEAVTYLTRAIDADSGSAQARFDRGLVFCQSGRPDDAVRDLVAAITLKPDFADAWVVLGMAYQEMGRLGDAEAALRTALSHHPDHPLAHNSLGVVYVDQERTAEAEAQFKRALEILPGHSTAAWNLASLYEQLGDLEAARRACDDGLTWCPESPQLLEKAADLFR